MELQLEIRQGVNHILVVAVDSSHTVIDQGYLLMINRTTGAVTRCTGVDPSLGFRLTEEGELLIEE